jgi:flagellar biosynthesis protein FlhB
MLKKDSYLMGILLAIPLPAAAFVVGTYVLQNSVLIINKPVLPYLVSFALNLIMMRLFGAEGLVKTVKGIMIATFLITVALFMFKFRLSI